MQKQPRAKPSVHRPILVCVTDDGMETFRIHEKLDDQRKDHLNFRIDAGSSSP